MESITGRRTFLAALRRGSRPTERVALASGLVALAGLLVADLSLGSSAAVTGTYLVAPFIAAMFGAVRPTLALALAAVALGAASSAWNMNFGITAYWVRLGGLAVGGAFALAAAWALERSRLSALRLHVLNQIGAIADGSLSLDETMRRVTELIVPIAADLCMLDVIHDGRVTRAAVRAEGDPGAARVEERIRRRRPSLPSWMVEDVPQWRHLSRFIPRMREEDLRRMAHDEDDLAFLRELAPHSSIVAPLLARGRSLGALTMVTAWSRRRFTTDDVRFAQILASRVALALDNTGIFSDLESVERRMDAVMSLIDEAVVVHDAGGRLVFANLAAARGLGYENAQQMIDAPAEEVRSRYELISENGERLDPAALGAELARREPAGRVPLRVVLHESGEERWAILASEAIRGPDRELLYTVTTVNDVTEVKRVEFAQRLLAGTGELLASSIDYRETLARVAMLAVPQFADSCTVNIPREDGMIEQVAVAQGKGARAGSALQLGDRFPGRLGDGSDLAEVIRSGRPLLRFPGEAGRTPEEPAGSGPDRGSSLVVPMSGGAGIVGALAFVNGRDSRAFAEADLEVAAEIARRAGLAVTNARLATEHAEVARTLQRGLLPPTPGDPRLERGGDVPARG